MDAKKNEEICSESFILCYLVGFLCKTRAIFLQTGIKKKNQEEMDMLAIPVSFTPIINICITQTELILFPGSYGTLPQTQ